MTKLEELKQIASRRTPGEWKLKYPEEWYAKFEPIACENPIIEVNNKNLIPNFYDYEEAGVPKADAEFIAMAANNIDKLIAVAEAAKDLGNIWEVDGYTELQSAIAALEKG